MVILTHVPSAVIYHTLNPASAAFSKANLTRCAWVLAFILSDKKPIGHFHRVLVPTNMKTNYSDARISESSGGTGPYN